MTETNKEIPGSAEKPDLSDKTSPTYLVGVYVAINAIKDAYILVDGPDCAHMKTQYLQGNHDWLSTLVSVSGFHRIANTSLHPAGMALSREDSIRANLANMASRDFVAGLYLSSMPMAFITGIDYERITRSVAEEFKKDVIHVPGKSLSGDWLDGYDEVLLNTAKQIDLPASKPVKNTVAVAGLLYDRNEGDNEGNVREITRLLNEMGLDVSSIWLSGCDFKKLKRVVDAEAIISLPYGRQAARILGKRLNVKVIETVLPFGVFSTEKFLRDIGKELDIKHSAETVIDRELSYIIPRMEWVSQFIFENLNCGYIGDPYLLSGFVEIAELIGAKVDFAFITNKSSHLKEFSALHGDRIKNLFSNPRRNTLMQKAQERLRSSVIHLIVTNNVGFQFGETTIVEFGFPSFFHHSLHEAPFLGFRGFLSFIDRMANQLRYNEVLDVMFSSMRKGEEAKERDI
jgi:nitrogenase molybdenum-iron protein alpha/beta subunit